MNHRKPRACCRWLLLSWQTMALHLHRAERTDLLADGLGALLSEPLPDPFAEELVIVPAKGVERWLSQRLSHILGRGDGADGVCAGVSFRNPHSLIAEITGIVDDDPWSPDAMVWPLLDVDRLQPRRTLVPHARHAPRSLRAGRGKGATAGPALRGGATARRAVRVLCPAAPAAARRLARRQHAGDLDDDLRWQVDLWRALVGRVDADPPHIRHAKTLARLRESPTDLPSRLSLFGHTRLPSTEIELLDALATHHDLHLWLPHPSDNLWTSLADLHGPIPRHDDTSHRAVRHPLLATLGRDLRELQRALPAGDTDEYLSGATRPDTSARLAAVRHRRQHGPARRPRARRERPLRAGAQLPRSRPPDRRAA